MAALYIVTGFNPRAHTGRDQGFSVVIDEENLFQSTRPHGARLPHPRNPRKISQVSIHAPTRGATLVTESSVMMM